MAKENDVVEVVKGPRKRNIGRKKSSKIKQKPKRMLQEGVGELIKPKKIDRKMKKLFRKRAREYNSDEEEDGSENGAEDENKSKEDEELSGGYSSEEAGEGDETQKGRDENFDEEFLGDEEDGDIQPGITKFTEGCRAFRMAFKSIIKKSVQDDGLGPVLSAHKKLVAEKLAEEDAERKVKRETRKEKHLVGEKGHVKPATYLDTHEKFLIGVATKGVVKLFNAVNKAQNAQKGMNPSRSKDAKVLRKRRKEAFFSELGKTSASASAANTPAKVQTSSGQADAEAPAWAPLRDNYMLTNSKLKDWDKMPDTAVTDDIRRMSEDSSSDDDD